MTEKEWQKVYDGVRRVREGWSCDDYYEDKPGLPDMVMMAQEIIELCHGDLERTQLQDEVLKPKEWFIILNDLYRYLKHVVDGSDRVERLVKWMVECAIRMMAREFRFRLPKDFEED